MKFGLIARSETSRGLGVQTLAMYQNLKPDSTLVIDVPQSGFPSHIENYPDSWTVTLTDGGLPEDVVRDWWADLDVVVSVETLYDDRMAEWARADNVRTVIHGNPEFVRPNRMADPDVWWYPTKWRLDLLPPGELIPVPVPDDTPIRRANLDQIPHFLHVAGNRAMGDRNGSLIVKQALKGLDSHAFLTSYCQKGDYDFHSMNPRAVELPPVEDRWTMYDNKHVLVLPRRFGGLCLPALEAMASGLVVMMPDCSPNTDWPVWSLPSEPSKVLQMPAGNVGTHDVLSTNLRTAMNTVATNVGALVAYQERVAEWVERNRWSVLRQSYYDAIETATRR